MESTSVVQVHVQVNWASCTENMYWGLQVTWIKLTHEVGTNFIIFYNKYVEGYMLQQK